MLRDAFSLRRLYSYARRETLELRRAPIRLTLAGLGSVILMFVMGYGISMGVEDLTFAALDYDQTTSRDYADLDQRMRAGDISLAIEIPPGFARDIARGTPAQVGAWTDGAMPTRAETGRGYAQGVHTHWLMTKALIMLVLLPLQMLSGGSTPRESMPEFVQFVMLAAPTTRFVMLAQAILCRGAGLAVVWPQCIALTAVGAALFSFSLTRFRKTIGAMA